jgi:hypothetical protein
MAVRPVLGADQACTGCGVLEATVPRERNSFVLSTCLVSVWSRDGIGCLCFSHSTEVLVAFTTKFLKVHGGLGSVVVRIDQYTVKGGHQHVATVYKFSIQIGNVLTSKQFHHLEVGFSPHGCQLVLGFTALFRACNSCNDSSKAWPHTCFILLLPWSPDMVDDGMPTRPCSLPQWE